MSVSRPGLLLLALAIATGGALACARGGDSGRSAACDVSAAPITLGPRVGAVSETTATVWIRACRPVKVSVQFKGAAAGWDQARESAAFKPDPKQDWTAVVQLTGLAPKTAYSYRIAVGGVPDDILSGGFQTMPPDQPGTLSFVFGADIRPEGSRVAFSALAAEHADFALFYGDQIYVDSQLPPATPHFDAHGKQDYEAAYRKAWAEPTFRSFIAGTPTFMVWDDHEILNDWDKGTASPYPWARAAYEEYEGSANPEPYRPGALYYVVRAGPAQFFVLDVRTYRSANSQRDDRSKTMLGPTQKAGLETWLLGSTAKFKFIVSPVMWSDHAKHADEAWPSFRHERDEILDYVTDHHVPGVVLLSGDEHWTGVFKLAPWNLYEFAPTPLAGFSGTATDANSPDVLFKLGQTATFGSMKIDTTTCPASLDFKVIDAFSNVRFALPLSDAQINAPIVRLSTDYCAAIGQGSIDSDGDGCSDASERGADEKRGGRRAPLDRWDFYDVNGDQRVDSRDTLIVADAIGSKIGDDGYDPAFDRSKPAAGADPWQAGPPDGIIDDVDFFLITAQIGDSCAAVP